MDETMKNAIQTVISAKIMEALDGPQRDAILAKAVKDSLSGYGFKNAIEKLVEEKAAAAARGMLESGGYDAEIDAAVRSGMSWLLADLPRAIRAAFLHALHNPPDQGGYGPNQSILAKYIDWPKKEACDAD